ncbi:MAG: helix-hairpin-helix domain-containing protein [Myxococcota bacterium]
MSSRISILFVRGSIAQGMANLVIIAALFTGARAVWPNTTPFTSEPACKKPVEIHRDLQRPQLGCASSLTQCQNAQAGDLLELRANDCRIIQDGMTAGMKLLLGMRLNVNRIGVHDLTALPGIGPKISAAIVAHRDQYGAFARLEDLQQVKGIGPKTVAKLRPYLEVPRHP